MGVQRMSDIVAIAAAELGTKESPPNSNKVKYNTWYYGREVSGKAYPWCMVFVQWVLDQAGVKPPIRTASCGALLTAARVAGEAVYTDFQPGDIVVYDFERDGTTDHCGIVESVDGAIITAIEGNTSVGNDSDGGEVMRRTRKTSQIVGAWRPKEENMTQETFNKMMDNYLASLAGEDPSIWSSEARVWAEENGIIRGDDKGNLQYKSFCTREQMCIFMKRLFDLLQ